MSTLIGQSSSVTSHSHSLTFWRLPTRGSQRSLNMEHNGQHWLKCFIYHKLGLSDPIKGNMAHFNCLSLGFLRSVHYARSLYDYIIRMNISSFLQVFFRLWWMNHFMQHNMILLRVKFVQTRHVFLILTKKKKQLK